MTTKTVLPLNLQYAERQHTAGLVTWPTIRTASGHQSATILEGGVYIESGWNFAVYGWKLMRRFALFFNVGNLGLTEITSASLEVEPTFASNTFGGVDPNVGLYNFTSTSHYGAVMFSDDYYNGFNPFPACSDTVFTYAEWIAAILAGTRLTYDFNAVGLAHLIDHIKHGTNYAVGVCNQNFDVANVEPPHTTDALMRVNLRGSTARLYISGTVQLPRAVALKIKGVM